MSFVTRLIVWLLPLTLLGCGYFSTPPIIQGRDKHYLNAQSIQPIRVPPGISGKAFRNDYPVSDHTYPNSAKAVSIMPPGLH